MSTEPIDFSALHDILILHKDGTMTPADEPYYEVKQIAPGTWQIMSSGDYHYLIEGEEEGIAVDTGYGAGNLRTFLEELIHKPVRRCINTHSHFDHTANNCYFDLVYMAEEGVDKAAIPYASFEGVSFPRDYEVQVVGDVDIIPLKGRDLQVFRVGDHTADGIAILDRKERLCFTGDELMHSSKSLRYTVEKLRQDMGKLEEHRSEFDRICGGPGIQDAEQVDIFYEAAGRILAGEPSNEPAPAPHAHPHAGEPENGQVIWECQAPHPQDAPKAGHGTEDGTVTYVWRGISFTYQADHVYNEK